MSATSGEIPLRMLVCNCPPEVAHGIAKALVERRLAACVNIVPGAISVYRWNGKVEDTGESTLYIKTRAELVSAVTQAIKGMHKYQVPEIVSLPIMLGEGNEAYRAWVAAETDSATTPRR